MLIDFTLLVRLRKVSGRLLVVTFLCSRKLYMDFRLFAGVDLPKLHIVQRSLYFEIFSLYKNFILRS